MLFKIADVTQDPVPYMVTWNSGTGEVLTTSTTFGDGLIFTDQAVRDAAIVTINNCAANTGRFIGHIPPPPAH